MLAKVHSAVVVGLSAVAVTVEVDVSDGLPAVTIVGLPDATVRESKERIRAAIRNTHFSWPPTRMTVSLAPADIRKEGSAFDLPIALGVLAASKQLDPALLHDTVILGELALDGTVRPVPGALAVALSLSRKSKRLLLPAANAAEAGLVENLSVYPIEDLLQAVGFLTRNIALEPVKSKAQVAAAAVPQECADFSEVKGQAVAKRAIEVAVIFWVDR